MDPITTAIVAAISSGLAEVGKEGALDAYRTLKSLLYRKFGPQSNIVKAVEELEANPKSSARTGVLQEEVAKAGANHDPELLRVAYDLQLRMRDASVHQASSANSGTAINSAKAKNVAAGNIIDGRTGLVVFLVIILVAIFAFLFWQMLPSIHGLIVSINSPATPTPKPTPTPPIADPAESLQTFCALIQSDGAEYAYTKLYSDNLKRQVTPSQFNQKWSFLNHPVSSCIGTMANTLSDTVSGTITVENFNTGQQEVYAVTLVKDSKARYWKIDSMRQIQ